MAIPDIKSDDLSDQVLDFLLSAPTPSEIVSMRPTHEAQERLSYLLDANRNDTLNDKEKAELEDYLRIEHFVRRLKIRAQEQLNK